MVKRIAQIIFSNFEIQNWSPNVKVLEGQSDDAFFIFYNWLVANVNLEVSIIELVMVNVV